MSRKTIEVEQVKEWVNHRLQIPDSVHYVGDLTPEDAYRMGVASLLEQILHATGNYKGFAYTDGEPAFENTRRRYS